MQKTKLLILFITILFPLIIQAEDKYKIYDTRQGKEVGVDAIAEAFSNADVLFFGEEHNDSIGHLLEKMILEKSFEKIGDKLVLSMEMFETDVQMVLDEYMAGLIKEKNLKKEARTWGNYDDYKPMVEYAKEHKLKVVAANTPARYVGSVSRNGMAVLDKLSTEAKKFLPPLPIDTATGKYHKKFLDIMGEHGNMPGVQMYQSQNLWDATMAYSIYKTLKKNKGSKVYHLNGKFHTDEKLGIPAQLANYAGKKEIRMLNISCFPDSSFNAPDWKKFATLGDYVIITDPVR